MSRIRSLTMAIGVTAALLLSGCSSANTMARDTTQAAPTINDTGHSDASGEAEHGGESHEMESTGATTTEAATSTASSSGSAAAGGAAECTPGALPTLTDGTLTIATSEPAFAPWIVDNDPTNGQGYESAVAYAVAEQLGYPKDKVTWARSSFDAIVAPTPKDYDFALNQVSITADRANAVDFSSGYYDVVQAIVTVQGSPIVGATTLAALKDAQLGAMIGTTSLESITTQIAPTSAPATFDSNDAAVQALQNGTIDGLVLDLPSAFFAAGAQLTDGVVVGQLPATGTASEQFGLVLDKDSALTGCVTAAVDALRADGTLAELVTEWISNSGAPELT